VIFPYELFVLLTDLWRHHWLWFRCQFSTRSFDSICTNHSRLEGVVLIKFISLSIFCRMQVLSPEKYWRKAKLKPGSHMPPMHLRHGDRYCRGYSSDMRTEMAGNLLIPVFTPGMPAKLTQVQLCRHARDRTLRWLKLPAAHVLIRPKSVPGGTGGYVADTSATYENQA